MTLAHTLLITLLSLSLASCNRDTKRNHYSTLDGAKVDGAIQRGWIPAILPQSARDIREEHDLDLNVGSGSFEFNTNDLSVFVSRLTPATSGTFRGQNLNQEAQVLGKSGYSLYRYEEAASSWVFAIDPVRSEE